MIEAISLDFHTLLSIKNIIELLKVMRQPEWPIVYIDAVNNTTTASITAGVITLLKTIPLNTAILLYEQLTSLTTDAELLKSNSK